LTERAKAFASDKTFDFKGEEDAFRTTFELLAKSLSGDSFRRYEKKKDRFIGGFSISAFEAIALGVGYNYKRLAAKPDIIVESAKRVWQEKVFTENSGAGVRAASRIPHVVPLGRRLFAP